MRTKKFTTIGVTIKMMNFQQMEMRLHKLNDKIAAQQAQIDELKQLLEKINASGK